MFPKTGSLTTGIEEEDEFQCFIWKSSSTALLGASGLISPCKDAQKSFQMQVNDVSEAPEQYFLFLLGLIL